MKAIAYIQNGLPLEHPDALVALDLPTPELRPHDLLVRVQALSVNPVDTKVRRLQPTDGPRVLGWDAAGVVQAVGSAVTRFQVGDAVYYAGAIDRPGAYAELQAVDERLVGHRPATLDAAQAAALPLTAITAWELLFDRLRVPEGGGQGQHLLVIGAGGGVGSILVQLARQLTGMTVIGTAGRPDTVDWLTSLGAHHVIDHRQPLAPQLAALGLPEVDAVISLTHTDLYFQQAIEVLKPQGQFALIDDPQTLDALPLKRKSISLHWELMFTRSLFQTPDMAKQHELLERVSALVDQGRLRTTLGQHLGPVSVPALKQAHALLESGQARGKLVLDGF